MFFNNRGFTVVELLIVISILAILTTIGVIHYQGLNKRARDSARRGDIHQIAIALEVNKNPDGYTPLQQQQFSSFQWRDPLGNAYCIAVGNPPDPISNLAWGDNCPSGYGLVVPGAPAEIFSSWKVCSFLENQTDTGQKIFCRSSAQ